MWILFLPEPAYGFRDQQVEMGVIPAKFKANNILICPHVVILLFTSVDVLFTRKEIIVLLNRHRAVCAPCATG